VSIIARGRALGWTLSLPEEDRNIVTRRQMKAEMAVALGGRTAEEIVFGEPSTGASNDIEKLSEMARNMVTRYGMSEELGPQAYGSSESDQYLGRSSMSANYGGEIAGQIDSEVRQLIQEAHDLAYSILTDNRDVLDSLADTLIEKETVDSKDLEGIWGHVEQLDIVEDIPEVERRMGDRRKRTTNRRRVAAPAKSVAKDRRSTGTDRRKTDRRTPAPASSRSKAPAAPRRRTVRPA
jgi:cell division protease FtsH